MAVAAVKFVSVEWYDAFYQEGPFGADEFDPGKGLLVVSAGVLVKESRDGVTLAIGVNVKDATYKDLFFVPRAIIKRVRRLK